MNSLGQQLLLSGGVWIVIGIVLTAIFARSKTGAETNEIAQKAASLAMHDLEERFDKVTVQLDKASLLADARRDVINVMQSQMDRQSRLIEEHTRWDRIVLRTLNEHAITGIPDPPALEHE